MYDGGLSQAEILDTISTNFSSIGVYHGSEGNAVVAWGHGAGDGIYDQFEEEFEKYGATQNLDSNQVDEMNDAINNDGIIDTMKANDFTGKEAAYTIATLWPDAGVTFDCDKTVTMPTGSEYDDLANLLLEAYPDELEIVRTDGDGTVTGETKHIDPVGFSVEDTAYEFVIDRNQDGVINDFSEMMGAADTSAFSQEEIDMYDTDGDGAISGLEELTMFDADGDGIITGDELENLLILKTDYNTGSYEFITAANAGVESIDLSTIADVSQTNSSGNESDFVDINGALVTNSFEVNMSDGSMSDGYQKYITEDFKDNIFGGILGENIYSELDSDFVNSAFDSDVTDPTGALAGLENFVDLVEDYKDANNMSNVLDVKLKLAKNEANAYLNMALAEENIESDETVIGEDMDELDEETSTTEAEQAEADEILNAYYEEVGIDDEVAEILEEKEKKEEELKYN